MDQLTSAEAQRIVAAASHRGQALGVPMTVAVVDAGGYLLALLRMDGARIIGPDIAISKAYTAAAFRAPSGDVAKRFQAAPFLVQSITVMTGGRFMPHPGGVPIVRDGAVVGAIGVGGGSSDQDMEVAQGSIADAELSSG